MRLEHLVDGGEPRLGVSGVAQIAAFVVPVVAMVLMIAVPTPVAADGLSGQLVLQRGAFVFLLVLVLSTAIQTAIRPIRTRSGAERDRSGFVAVLDVALTVAVVAETVLVLSGGIVRSFTPGPAQAGSPDYSGTVGVLLIAPAIALAAVVRLIAIAMLRLTGRGTSERSRSVT